MRIEYLICNMYPGEQTRKGYRMMSTLELNPIYISTSAWST